MNMIIFVELLILFAFHEFEICNSILNGDPARFSDFPFVVQIVSRRNSQHICAGTLITKQHVLTAAHCALGNNKNKVVMIKLPHAELGFDIDYVEIEDPNPKNLCDNLAVVKLQGQIPDNPNLNTIAVSSKDFLRPLCSVLGLGWTVSETDLPPYSLKKLIMIAEPSKQCEKDLNIKLKPGQFCTFGTSRRGFQPFDVGGPIILDSTLVGIITGCSKESSVFEADLHVGLHEHLGFIRAKTDETLQLRSVECTADFDDL